MLLNVSIQEYVEIIKESLAKPLFPVYEQVAKVKTELWITSLNHWYYDDLHKWTWWLSLALTIIPLLVWWKIVDRKKLLTIVVVGLLANIFSAFLDVMGSEAVLWGYPDRLLPNLPRLLPIDFTVIPVTFMLLYQFLPDWKRYFPALIMMSFLFSFAAEPLMVCLKLYELYSWKYIYSFPIYIAMGIIIKWLAEKFWSIQQKADKQE